MDTNVVRIALSQMYGGYQQHVNPVVMGEVEAQKARSMYSQSIANTIEQMSSHVELRSWNELLVTHEQIPSVYTQTLDGVLSLALDSNNQFLNGAVSTWARQLEEVSTYLQTEIDQSVVDGKKMAILKKWILTESSVFLMPMGYTYMLSFTERSPYIHTDEGKYHPRHHWV